MRLLFVVFLLLLAGSQTNFRTPDSLLLKRLEGEGIHIDYFRSQHYNLRYMVSGDSTKNQVFLFLHGSPGSLEQWAAYHKDTVLLKRGLVVSVDRPGYGYSNLGEAVSGFEEECQILQPFIEELSDAGKIIIVAHSFGGPPAVKLTAENPDRVSGLFLMATAIDPENEAYIGLAKAGMAIPLRWLISRSTKVSAIEKLYHVEELRKMESDWNRVRCPVLYFHAENDMIVPFANYDYISGKLPEGQLTRISFERGNHFTPFLMREEMVGMLVGNL